MYLIVVVDGAVSIVVGGGGEGRRAVPLHSSPGLWAIRPGPDGYHHKVLVCPSTPDGTLIVVSAAQDFIGRQEL